MGCFRCSSRFCVNLAGVITIIESVLGITWNIFAIVIIRKPYLSFGYEILDKIVEDFSSVEDKIIVYRLLLFSAILNGVWCAASVFLLIGNKLKSICLITQWIITMTLVFLGNASATIYFGYKASVDVKMSGYPFLEVLSIIHRDSIYITIISIVSLLLDIFNTW
ncbi:uncharacterized protein [Centruroides vittatus]|uniref:uncharacterized protein n=1 Tax=Centruroides vittatus TaxID=120091 RepID=UPI00350F2EFD